MLHTGKDITPILLILFKNFNIHNINTDTNTFTTSCAKNNISSTSLRVTLQLETKFSSDVKPILNILSPFSSGLWALAFDAKSILFHIKPLIC